LVQQVRTWEAAGARDELLKVSQDALTVGAEMMNGDFEQGAEGCVGLQEDASAATAYQPVPDKLLQADYAEALFYLGKGARECRESVTPYGTNMYMAQQATTDFVMDKEAFHVFNQRLQSLYDGTATPVPER
jgi:hypothetical protein